MGITSPNPAFRNQLSRCVQKWRDQQGPDLTSIKPSKLEAAVSKIRNDAHRLLGDLHRAKGDSQEAWDYEGAAIELCIEPSLAQELGRIIRLADEWLDAQGKGESGRPANSVLRSLIKVYDDLHRSGHRRNSLRRFLGLCRDHLSLPLPLERVVWIRRSGAVAAKRIKPLRNKSILSGPAARHRHLSVSLDVQRHRPTAS